MSMRWLNEYPRNHAVAEGSIFCSTRSFLGRRRINRCSIGVLVREKYDEKLRAHEGRKPELDNVGERWVESIEWLFKKVQASV